jgi:hypothetical protein
MSFAVAWISFESASAVGFAPGLLNAVYPGRIDLA